MHEPTREISADRQQRQPDRSQSMFDFSEVAPHPGITSKINISRRTSNDVAAPERRVAIAQPAPREMFRRHADQTEFVSNLRVFPPIKFDHFIDPTRVEERAIAEAGDKAWAMLGV